MTTVDEYLAGFAFGKELGALIDEALPDAPVMMWHGHPVWKVGNDPVALVKAYPNHVTFGLWKGRLIEDASGRLTPGAREMANVKLRTAADIDAPLFTAWLRAARRLH